MNVDVVALTALILGVINALGTFYLLARHFSTHRIEYLPQGQYQALRKKAETAPPPEDFDVNPEELKKLSKEMDEMFSNFMENRTNGKDPEQ